MAKPKQSVRDHTRSPHCKTKTTQVWADHRRAMGDTVEILTPDMIDAATASIRRARTIPVHSQHQIEGDDMSERVFEGYAIRLSKAKYNGRPAGEEWVEFPFVVSADKDGTTNYETLNTKGVCPPIFKTWLEVWENRPRNTFPAQVCKVFRVSEMGCWGVSARPEKRCGWAVREYGSGNFMRKEGDQQWIGGLSDEYVWTGQPSAFDQARCLSLMMPNRHFEVVPVVRRLSYTYVVEPVED